MTKPILPKSETTTKEGRIFASVILWFFVALILGTVAGVWVKLFWLGWVLAGR